MLGPLRRRLAHYAVFTVLFAMLYAGVLVGNGSFPPALLFGILALSLVKDVLDEVRLQRGDGPIAFLMVEHLPSNLVLLGLLGTGVVVPPGALALPGAGTSVSLWALAVGLAAVDALVDLSQDLREA